MYWPPFLATVAYNDEEEDALYDESGNIVLYPYLYWLSVLQARPLSDDTEPTLVHGYIWLRDIDLFDNLTTHPTGYNSDLSLQFP